MYVQAVAVTDIDEHLLEMAHKYNLNRLFTICDAHLATYLDDSSSLSKVKKFMGIATKFRAPCLVSKIVEWKQNNKEHDDFWKDFIMNNADFAQMVALDIGFTQQQNENTKVIFSKPKNIYYVT